jgi:transcriptional regulator with XRE-family HTH domain
MSATYIESYKIIGRTIRRYRKEAGLTQEALAEKAHISISYLTKIEAAHCDKSFSLAILFQIADALDIDFRLLFEQVK